MTETTVSATPSPTPATKLISSAMLVMGVTGSGKSTLLTTLAEYVWRRYRKVTLLYLIDGGGAPTQMQALVNRGIVRWWRLRSRSGEGLVPGTLYRAAQGWWPRRINPLTGECAPTEMLVPPVTDVLRVRCAQGHPVMTAAFQSQITPRPCPTCGVHVTPQNMSVERTSAQTKGFENVGAVFYDGLTSACAWLVDSTTHLDMGGEKSALGGAIISDGVRLNAATRAQVGFGQGQAEAWVNASNGIPGLVIPPVWTALTLEVSDEGGLGLVGPKLTGKARTEDAPQWFSSTLETMVVRHDEKNWRRLQLSEFVDEHGRKHLCKVRSYPGLMPSYLEDEDAAVVSGEAAKALFVNFNLGRVHELLDQARETTEARLREEFADAPGMPEGMSEVGEVAAPPPAAAPPTVAKPVAAAPVAPPAATPKPPPTASPSASPVTGAVAGPSGGPPAAPPVRPAPVPAQVARPTGGVPPATTPTTPAPKPPQAVMAPPAGRPPRPGTPTAHVAAAAQQEKK